MKKIGILYICTGNYSKLWPDFYASCEKFFLNNHEKHYFVFTDNNDILDLSDSRIITTRQEKLEWPMPTLLRYKLFNEKSQLFSKMDYLIFCNANLLFQQKITFAEIFGNYNLFATLHPGYFDKGHQNFPFETNPDSLAYLEHEKKHKYVCGGFNGGKRNAFIEMSYKLSKKIEKDLNNNLIARWHDESYFNHFFNNNREKFHLIGENYCWPEYFLENKPPKVLVRDKRKVFSLRERGIAYTIKFFYLVFKYYLQRLFQFTKRQAKILGKTKFYYTRKLHHRKLRILDIGLANSSIDDARLVFKNLAAYHGLDKFEIGKDCRSKIDKFFLIDLEKDLLNDLPDKYYDLIIINHVIEHLENGLEVVDNLSDKINNNGHFFIEFPNINSLAKESMFSYHFHCDPTHKRFYNLTDMANVLLSKNFKIVSAGYSKNIWKTLLAIPNFLILWLKKEKTGSACAHFTNKITYIHAQKRQKE